jgi:hypothetical protein
VYKQQEVFYELEGSGVELDESDRVESGEIQAVTLIAGEENECLQTDEMSEECQTFGLALKEYCDGARRSVALQYRLVYGEQHDTLVSEVFLLQGKSGLREEAGEAPSASGEGQLVRLRGGKVINQGVGFYPTYWK